MRLLQLFLCITKFFIKNNNLPVCANCIYFQKYNNKFESLVDNKIELIDNKIDSLDSELSLCKKFGKKDIITGKITYIYASICRESEYLCNKNGQYYEKK